jgi:hypothetical protein
MKICSSPRTSRITATSVGDCRAGRTRTFRAPAADEPESLGGEALVERLAARIQRRGFAPSLDDEPWFRLARKLRSASDYVRFHDEAFATFRRCGSRCGSGFPEECCG